MVRVGLAAVPAVAERLQVHLQAAALLSHCSVEQAGAPTLTWPNIPSTNFRSVSLLLRAQISGLYSNKSYVICIGYPSYHFDDCFKFNWSFLLDVRTDNFIPLLSAIGTRAFK